jgi:hypothetical protein
LNGWGAKNAHIPDVTIASNAFDSERGALIAHRAQYLSTKSAPRTAERFQSR